jgi:hypothetical protein
MVATTTTTVKEILAEMNEVTAELLKTISSFNQQQLNTIPFKGSWTPAQVAEHVFKSDYELLKVLYGPTEPTERPIDENVEGLKQNFLDFSIKFNSPEEIIPDDTTYEKEILMDALNYSRSRLREAIKTLDITALCHDPRLGKLTRYELLHFIIFHTKRHIHQLKNMNEEV